MQNIKMLLSIFIPTKFRVAVCAKLRTQISCIKSKMSLIQFFSLSLSIFVSTKFHVTVCARLWTSISCIKSKMSLIQFFSLSLRNLTWISCSLRSPVSIMSAFVWEKPWRQHVVWWILCAASPPFWSLLSSPLNVTAYCAMECEVSGLPAAMWSEWLREVSCLIVVPRIRCVRMKATPVEGSQVVFKSAWWRKARMFASERLVTSDLLFLRHAQFNFAVPLFVVWLLIFAIALNVHNSCYPARWFTC